MLHKLKEKIGTLLEKYNYLLLFFKTGFFSLNLCSNFFSRSRNRSRSPDLEPEPGQSWTGSTTLHLIQLTPGSGGAADSRKFRYSRLYRVAVQPTPGSARYRSRTGLLRTGTGMCSKICGQRPGRTRRFWWYIYAFGLASC